MKIPLPFLCCLLTICRLHAEFEKWTSADGKSAELELTDVKREGGSIIAKFQNKDGKTIELDLKKLSNADEVRARAWRPLNHIRTKFTSVGNDSPEGKHRTSFRFEMAGRGLLNLVFKPESSGIIRPGKPEILRLVRGGKPVEFENCTAWLEISPFGWEEKGRDPFADRNDINVEEEHRGELRVSISGTPVDLDGEECELEAKLYFEHVSVPKEAEAMVEVSKTLDALNYQPVGQFKVALRPLVMWDSRRETEVQALEKRGPEGYSLIVQEDANQRLIISEFVVINGKRIDPMLFESKATRFRVVIKYWSVVKELPFIVRKEPEAKGKH